MCAEVAQTRRRQQRITSRVRRGVTVRMPSQSRLARPFQAREVQGAALLKRVYVNAQPYPRNIFHCSSLQAGIYWGSKP
jgi:hypothetical protein